MRHPGPWKYVIDQIVDSRPEDGTADCVVVDRVRDVDADDMRLILAAPELLEVTKGILGELAARGMVDDGSGTTLAGLTGEAQSLIEDIEKGTTP